VLGYDTPPPPSPWSSSSLLLGHGRGCAVWANGGLLDERTIACWMGNDGVLEVSPFPGTDYGRPIQFNPLYIQTKVRIWYHRLIPTTNIMHIQTIKLNWKPFLFHLGFGIPLRFNSESQFITSKQSVNIKHMVEKITI
jgi:hypothetical protein